MTVFVAMINGFPVCVADSWDGAKTLCDAEVKRLTAHGAIGLTIHMHVHEFTLVTAAPACPGFTAAPLCNYCEHCDRKANEHS